MCIKGHETTVAHEAAMTQDTQIKQHGCKPRQSVPRYKHALVI